MNKHLANLPDHDAPAKAKLRTAIVYAMATMGLDALAHMAAVAAAMGEQPGPVGTLPSMMEKP